MAFLGWGIVLLSSLLIDHFELFGLRQVVRHFLGKAPAAPELRERSLYPGCLGAVVRAMIGEWLDSRSCS